MRRMEHNLEYVRNIIKQDNRPNVEVGSLENGLYLIKVLNVDAETFTAAYVSLDDHEYPTYWPINFIDNGKYVTPALISLTRPSLLSKQAELTITFSEGEQVSWLDQTKVNMVDIYRVN